MTGKTGLAFDTKHGALVAYALWFSLGEALRNIGEIRANDGWKENLYDTCLQYVENMQVDSSWGDQERLAQLEELFSPEAKRAAVDAITAAFDRIRYME